MPAPRCMDYGPNCGLMDARGLAQTMYVLGSGFRAVEFADACTMFEEMVLRERIVLSGKLSMFPRHLQETLRPFLADGIFIPLGCACPLPELGTGRALKNSRMIIEAGLTATTLEDARYEVRRVLGAEEVTGTTATPLLRNLQHYDAVRRSLIETAVWDLAAQYRELADLVRSVRARLQRMSGLPVISFPPIALLAISRATDFGDVMYEVLQLRHEFRHLRAATSELEERLRTDSMTAVEALDLEYDWRRRWYAMAGEATRGARLSLGRTCPLLLKGSAKIAVAAAAGEPAMATTALVDIFKAGVEARRHLLFRPIHRSVSNYIQTRDLELRGSVSRLFRLDLVKIEHDMTALVRANSPWRPAYAAAS